MSGFHLKKVEYDDEDKISIISSFNYISLFTTCYVSSWYEIPLFWIWASILPLQGIYQPSRTITNYDTYIYILRTTLWF